MRLAPAVPFEPCVDTDEILDGAKCAALWAAGIKGVWRYLEDLTPGEVAAILGSGLKLFFVNHSRLPGWIPSAGDGAMDAARDVLNLKKLGIPKGVHVAFDLEGVGGGITSVSLVEAHVISWSRGVQSSSNLAALYVGEGALLTSRQLFALPPTLYWASCSLIVDVAGNAAVPECDWSVLQGRPFDVIIGGVKVDFDVVFADNRGRVPIGVAA
jgi:hypothetical protein